MCSTGSDLDRRWGRAATSRPDRAIHVRLHASVCRSSTNGGCHQMSAWGQLTRCPRHSTGQHAFRSLASLMLLRRGGICYSGKMPCLYKSTVAENVMFVQVYHLHHLTGNTYYDSPTTSSHLPQSPSSTCARYLQHLPHLCSLGGSTVTLPFTPPTSNSSP